jgi:hypothetical protein
MAQLAGDFPPRRGDFLSLTSRTRCLSDEVLSYTAPSFRSWPDADDRKNGHLPSVLDKVNYQILPPGSNFKELKDGHSLRFSGESDVLGNDRSVIAHQHDVSGVSIVRVCYHAATRTGQNSPISPHVGGILVCGFLWG